MSKLVVTEFVTLDGVFEDPGGAEGLEHGGWAFRFGRGPEGDKFKLDETMSAGAQLLGRVTYQGFAAAWPKITDEEGFADRMNTMPKYVVSTTLDRAEWNNTTILRGDLAEEVRRLKGEVSGDILIAGSGSLVAALAPIGLIDEYRLMVYPVVLGAGKRLFPDGSQPADLQLVSCSRAGETVILTYQSAPEKS
jgi:dihydrofolate reductase